MRSKALLKSNKIISTEIFRSTDLVRMESEINRLETTERLDIKPYWLGPCK